MTLANRESILFCLCGPSGVGKSTISFELLKCVAELKLSVSATTRALRSGELEGIHYFFKSHEMFEGEIARGEFLEWARYNNNYYGTPFRNLRECEGAGQDLLLDIDVQGAKALKEKLGSRVVVIFLSAPSFEELQERLAKRGSETVKSQADRLKLAKEEQRILSHPEVSDYLVINNSQELAIDECRAIIEVERKRLSRFKTAYRRRLSGS